MVSKKMGTKRKSFLHLNHETPESRYTERINKIIEEAQKAGVTTLADDNRTLADKNKALATENEELKERISQLERQVEDLKEQLDAERDMAGWYREITTEGGKKKENSVDDKAYLSEFHNIDGFEKMSWGEQIEKFAEKMINTGLVNLVEERNFYKISINIPGKGETTLLCTKDEFDTDDDNNKSKISEYDNRAKSYGCDKMEASDAPILSKELFEMLDKLGNKNYDGNPHAFFARFMHIIMHKFIANYGSTSYFWYKDRVRDENIVTNVACMFFNSTDNRKNGIPHGNGWSLESGRFLYIGKNYYR